MKYNRKETMIQKIVDYLEYISGKTDGEVWMNDEQDKAIFKVALKNELLDIREDQTDLDGWHDPDAYIERYVSVSDEGMKLLRLADDMAAVAPLLPLDPIEREV